MMDGLAGWVNMTRERTEELRTVDAAITIVGTLLVSATFALLHR
jgi:hypothetical protein